MLRIVFALLVFAAPAAAQRPDTTAAGRGRPWPPAVTFPTAGVGLAAGGGELLLAVGAEAPLAGVRIVESHLYALVWGQLAGGIGTGLHGRAALVAGPAAERRPGHHAIVRGGVLA